MEAQEQKQPASLGKPERITGVVLDTEVGKEAKPAGEEGGGELSEEEKAKLEQDSKNDVPDLSDEQLSKLLEKKGITGFKNLEEVRAKLASPAAKTEKTPEEIAAAEKEFEKRQLDLFLATGGTVENFAGIKAVMAMDLKELSISDIKKEMKAADFSEDEIDAVLQERYYQKNPDELEQLPDEEDDDFEARKAAFKKKHEFATKKIIARGENIKKNAESVLKNLRTAIEQSDLQKRELDDYEDSVSSTVEEFLQNSPKERTYELGKMNDVDILPVKDKVFDEDIAEVKAILKDKEQRNKIFYTPEGNLNWNKIAEIMLDNASYKRSLPAIYSAGGSRQVEEFEKTFPYRTPFAVGLNGNGGKKAVGEKGIPASLGKSQRVQS